MENPLGTKKLKNFNFTIKGEYYLRISDVRKEISDIIVSIAKDVLSTEGNIAIVTRTMLLKDILELLETLNFGRSEYFLAKMRGRFSP